MSRVEEITIFEDKSVHGDDDLDLPAMTLLLGPQEVF
jgi:hypothetical protein